MGGGSNAIGLFSPFYDDTEVEMIGVEPAGKGLDTGMHAATLALGKPVYSTVSNPISYKMTTEILHLCTPYQQALIIQVLDRNMHSLKIQVGQNM